jgi:hypothetical protein
MTDNSELVKNFAALFAGRTDAYGSWEGGCVKQPVTQGSFTKHLWGQEYIGIYPMMDDSTVWWGCSDIDVNDIDQARNIQLALKLKLIESWVERTVKGFHVWVFARKPVEARVMRRALLVAHAAVKVPAKEINPKQEQVSGYGNYVRLPYPGALFEPCSVRFIIDSSDKPMSLETFVNEATTYAVTQEDLQPLADAYIPKTPAQFTAKGAPIPVDVAKTMLHPWTLKMFLEGPMADTDRSSCLVKLAYRFRSDGIPIELAYGLIRTADMQWGKFHSREDGEMHLTKIIADVYGE